MQTKVSHRVSGIEKSLIRQIYDSAPSDAVNLGLGEIQFPMPSFLKDKATELVRTTTFSYTPNAGLPELRAAIARHYDDEANTEGVCVTNGAEEALYASLTSYIDTGDKVIILEPCYPAYSAIIRMLGGVPVSVPLDAANQFQLDDSVLNEAMKLKPKCLLICYPSNPLGTIFTEKEINIIIEGCRQNDVILIVDEVYRELSLDIPIPSFYGKYDQLLIVSGVSKSHCMTGWRIGWVIGNEQLVKPIVIAHQYISTCAGNLGQRLAISALSAEGMESLTRLNDTLETNYQICMDILNRSTKTLVIKPAAAFYLFLNIQHDDLAFAQKLAKSGVITAPGRAFGMNGTGWLRISYGLGVAKLEEGLDVLVRKLVKL